MTNIDYGRGRTNIDRTTGIRYGVLPQKDILRSWAEASEPYYGDPTCPKCGNDALELPSASPDDLGGDDAEHDTDCACPSCHYVFGSQSAFGDSPLGFHYSDADIDASCGEHGDIYITRSAYYTRAPFCSPCAPGACYLRDGRDDSSLARAYCFPPDWFGTDSPCPYPVWRVSDDALVYSPITRA